MTVKTNMKWLANRYFQMGEMDTGFVKPVLKSPSTERGKKCWEGGIGGEEEKQKMKKE